MTPAEAMALQPWDIVLHDARLLLVVLGRPHMAHGRNVLVFVSNGNFNSTVSALNSRLVYRPTVEERGEGNGVAITTLLEKARALLDEEEATAKAAAEAQQAERKEGDNNNHGTQE